MHLRLIGVVDVKLAQEESCKRNADETLIVSNEFSSNSKCFTLLLPYTGHKGEHLIRSLRMDMPRTLPENFQISTCYNGMKLAIKYNNIKDLVKKSHQQDVVYYATCLEPGCVEDCFCETNRRLNEMVTDHNGRFTK